MQSLVLVSDHKEMTFFFPPLLIPLFARFLTPGCPFSSGFYLCHLSPLFCLHFLFPFLVSLSFPPCLDSSSLLFPDPWTLPPTTPGHPAVKSVSYPAPHPQPSQLGDRDWPCPSADGRSTREPLPSCFVLKGSVSCSPPQPPIITDQQAAFPGKQVFVFGPLLQPSPPFRSWKCGPVPCGGGRKANEGNAPGGLDGSSCAFNLGLCNDNSLCFDTWVQGNFPTSFSWGNCLTLSL